MPQRPAPPLACRPRTLLPSGPGFPCKQGMCCFLEGFSKARVSACLSAAGWRVRGSTAPFPPSWLPLLSAGPWSRCSPRGQRAPSQFLSQHSSSAAETPSPAFGRNCAADTEHFWVAFLESPLCCHLFYLSCLLRARANLIFSILQSERFFLEAVNQSGQKKITPAEMIPLLSCSNSLCSFYITLPRLKWYFSQRLRIMLWNNIVI